MAKYRTADEVQVFRFFEEAPMEKAETVFKIVSQLMRTRNGTSAAARPASRRANQAPQTHQELSQSPDAQKR